MSVSVRRMGRRAKTEKTMNTMNALWIGAWVVVAICAKLAAGALAAFVG